MLICIIDLNSYLQRPERNDNYFNDDTAYQTGKAYAKIKLKCVLNSISFSVIGHTAFHFHKRWIIEKMANLE